MRPTDSMMAVTTALLLVNLAAAPAADEKKAQVAFQAAVARETIQGDLKGAIELFNTVVAEAGSNRSLAAQALVRMAECYQKLGDDAARRVYERLLRDYGDQADAVAVARAKLGGSRMASGDTVKGDRAVWTGRSVDMFGQISPDGRYLTYVDWARSFNLMVRDLVTNTDRALTDLPSMSNNPSWVWTGEASYSTISKDGTRVAYAWWSSENHHGIRITNLAPGAPGVGAPRQLMTVDEADVRFVSPYDWSSDGRSLAVLLNRTDGTGQITVVSATDGAVRILKSVDWKGPKRMFFSPDSRHLAYDLPASDDAQERDVFVISLDGLHDTPVVVHPANDELVGWSPDGRQLLFTSNRTGSNGLWSQPVEDGRPRLAPELLRSDIGTNVLSLGLTAKGTLVLYRNTSSRDVRILPIDLASGRTTGPSRGFTQGFLDGPRVPDWSPDGKQVAYQACDGNCLAVRSVETGAVRKVGGALLYPSNPRWSPDGRRFLSVARDRRGRDRIVVIDAESGAVTSIVDKARLGWSAAWAPDGQKIYYTDRDGRRIVERDLTSGAERDIVRDLRPSWNIRVSPDGRHVLARTALDRSSNAERLWLVPVDGSAPREILRLSPPDAILDGPATAFTPDSAAVLVARTREGRAELWKVPVSGEPPTKLTIDANEWIEGARLSAQQGFSLSRDGRHIAFLAGRSASEVWAIENIWPQ